MGFRFSKRVKILPGLRLNFSGSGVSVSAGVRGARVTFGPRGTYANFGIPGTGISYRERVGGGRRSNPAIFRPALTGGDPRNDPMAEQIINRGDQILSFSVEDLKRYAADPRFTLSDPQTGRRWSRRELEAKIRELECANKAEAAQKRIDNEQAHYQAILNHWLPLPEVPDHAGFVQALNKYPYHFEPPKAPDFEQQKLILLEELTQEYKQRLPYRLLPEAVARKKARTELPKAWPQRAIALSTDHAQRLQEYDQAHAAWDQQEEARVASLKKLIEGDLQETHRWAADLVESLRFPFDTHCDVFLRDPKCVYIHLDLPEVEDVIPAARKQVLETGEIGEVIRKRDEVNADYAYLVIGQCLLIAAALFACLPLTDTVQLAAYTQRPRVRESDPVNTYLLDVPFTRTALRQFQTPANLVSYIIKLGGRINPQSANLLGAIPPPSWMDP